MNFLTKRRSRLPTLGHQTGPAMLLELTKNEQTGEELKYWWETSGRVPATDLAGRLELIKKSAESSIERENMSGV